MNKEKFISSPCIEENCSECCDPVKVAAMFPEEQVPVNKKGGKIWKETGEILIPEKHIDTIRLKTYKCVNYDKKTGKCLDYENRPQICKNTNCSEEEAGIKEKFIKIKKKAV